MSNFLVSIHKALQALTPLISKKNNKTIWQK